METRFTKIGVESRRILQVADLDRQHTTILNEPPPFITTEELGRFAADYRRLMTEATAVVLTGSLPAGLPPEIYGSLATLRGRGRVPPIIDARGPALWYAVSRRPALVIARPRTRRCRHGRVGPMPPGRADAAGRADAIGVGS